MFPGAWMCFVLLGVAGVFGYHLWLGWRTRIVRFPMSVLSLQEFEHDQSPANFWGVMAANLIGLAAALAVAIFFLGSVVVTSPRPIAELRTLDGCYEGEGLPDFMRPPVHWAMRLDNGVVSNRAGEIVSQLRLLGSTKTKTSVAFSPGILISVDEHKSSTTYPGDTVRGTAYLIGGRATITLASDWGDVLLKTTCG